MLLQKLVEFSQSGRMEGIAPLGYGKKTVHYLIELDRTGQLCNPTPLDLSNPRNKRREQRVEPNVVRSIGVKPLLLADNAEYTLNLPREPRNIKRVADCHSAYIALLSACVQATRDEYAAAVLSFLTNAPLSQLRLPEDFDRRGTIIFRVEDIFPTERPAIQQFWASYNAPRSGRMQCLSCGQLRPIMKRLHGKIKGIPGGQSSGTSIISANADAFESYGLEASQTAPSAKIAPTAIPKR